MKLTQADFEKLVADVEKEMDIVLAKAESEAKPEESLAKSEDKADEKKEAKDDAAKADDKKDEDKHDYDDADMEEMHKMYASMGKSERAIHHDAIKKCMEKCGEMMVAKSEEQPKEEPLKKSEDAEVLKKAEETAALMKSELDAKTKELEGAKKENDGLKKNVDELIAALNGFLTKKGPQRKAITSIEYVKKSEVEDKKPEVKTESLSKNEITAILTKKASDPSLSKKDREAIDKYYLKGASLEVVKHLLTQ